MDVKKLSPDFKFFSKLSAILSMLIVIFPMVFLIPGGGEPNEGMSHSALLGTHTHLAGNTFLFFIVGYLFLYSSFKKAKKIWPAISAISVIVMTIGLLVGSLPVIMVGTIAFAVTILVMGIGILGWV